MLVVRGFMADVEIDTFSEGITDHVCCKQVDVTLKGHSREELAQELRDWFNDDAGFEFDVCDELGRVDVQQMEDADGLAPDGKQIERWKAGELELYLVTYTGYLERITPHEWGNMDAHQGG